MIMSKNRRKKSKNKINSITTRFFLIHFPLHLQHQMIITKAMYPLLVLHFLFLCQPLQQEIESNKVNRVRRELQEHLRFPSFDRARASRHMSTRVVRRRLAEGLEIPEWFSFPEVVKELRRRYPPRAQQGFTVFFTGFSGSGKSTIANALMVKLMEMGGRPVTLLDGDIVRKNLSSELGFSKEHRDLNIRRIGYVASEITKNGGIAICAPIAPYTATRRTVREMIEEYGAFIEVHVATSVEECERRDRKGLYKLAREGKIKEFTGISDPYETPTNAELVCETVNVSPDDCAHDVMLKLESMGLIAG